MSSRHRRDATPGSSDRLKVRRLSAGEQLHVKVLTDVGERIMGLIYHWVGGKGGRSVPCLPKCPEAIHRQGEFWHGYLAVEIWNEPGGPWWPWVLEVSEALELDMRGKVRRGQTWLISRAVNEKGKQAELTGLLTEECPPHAVPMAFDIRPVLWSIYHTCAVELRVPNPMPDRVYVRGSDAPPPAAVQPDQAEQPASAEELADVRRHLRERGFVKPLGKVHERNGG